MKEPDEERDNVTALARQYAVQAYALLDVTSCPGGKEHEGQGGASFCDACLVNALASAWKAGRSSR